MYKHFFYTNKILIMLRTNLLTLLILTCITTASFGQFSLSFDSTDPTCNGFTNGFITTNPDGGTAPFIYSYSNFFSVQTISGLSAGAYSVTVTDANNETATGSIILNEPAAIDGGLSVDDVCSGNGNVSSNATGGAGAYSYSWDDGQTTANATGLAPGLHCLTTSDVNGCEGVSCIIVADQVSLEVIATTALACFDACDASITATVSGGTGPYTFIWNTGSTTPILESVPVGTYSVTVTDGNGCVTSETTTVSAPSQIDVTVTVANPDCGTTDTGSATASASGGTAPYQYMWNGGQMGPTLNNLTPGNYMVVVTDANGCQEIQGFAVIPASSTFLDVTTTDASACGAADGTATASVSGGTAPYSYVWNTGSSDSSIDGLAPGAYGVTVTDADGCGATATANIGGSPDLTLTSMGVDSECGSQDGGSAIVMAFDGTAPYTFLWSNGATIAVTSNLDAGTYTVTVTDAADCTATATVTVSSTGSLTVNASGTNLSCGNTDGSATAIPADGTASYTYTWSNGGNTATINNLSADTYTVTTADATGCSAVSTVTLMDASNLEITVNSNGPACDGPANASATATANTGNAPFTYVWSNGEMTSTISNIMAGNYAVTVTDTNGCQGTGSLTVSSSPGLQLNINTIAIECFGGSGVLSVEVTGGSAPFTYLWSNGIVIASNELIPAEQYSVTVTDAAGCTSEATANLTEPNPLVLTVTSTDAGCGGTASGTATSTLSGGTAPYTYNWSNDATTTNLTGLAADTYALTVTDANGCVQQASVSITESSNPMVTATITGLITTVGGNDGEAMALATGGTAPYDFAWSNGQNTATATGLSAGTYTVTVTDANGCTDTATITIPDPAKLGDKIFVDSNNNGCQDADEGGWFNLTVILNGTDNNGTTMGQTTQTDVFGNYIFDGLNPGTYTVRIVAPTGYEITTPNACGDDTTDSDANQNDGTTNAITLSAGQCYLDLDIGISEICANFDDPGEICCDQMLCAPGNTPDPLTSIAPATGGSGAVDYIWMMSTNNGPFNPSTWTLIPGATGLDYAPGALYETTYFARCARRAPCTNYLETETVTIVVETAFSAVINGSDLNCVGDVVTFSSVEFGAGTTYQWNFGSLASPSTANTASVDVTWYKVTSTTITLTVTNTDGCTSTNSMAVAITNAPIFCGPGVINMVANVNNNGTVALNWEAAQAGANTNLTIQRSADGVNFTALEMMNVHTNSAYTYLDTAPMRGQNAYRVMIEDNMSNTMYSEIATVTIATSRELFFLYPNPFTDELTISVAEEVNSIVQVNIFTAQGQLTKSMEIEEGNYGQQMNMEDMPSGIYYVRFQFGAQGNRVVKVIKE
ncbi:MAG: hypothetical protein ACI920_000349 [Saprospiraceae bacterium]|jgi:hypothetical protein